MGLSGTGVLDLYHLNFSWWRSHCLLASVGSDTKAHGEDLFESAETLLLGLLDDCTEVINLVLDIIHTDDTCHVFLPLRVSLMWYLVKVVINVRAQAPLLRDKPPWTETLLEVHDDKLSKH